eukprot:991118_1
MSITSRSESRSGFNLVSAYASIQSHSERTLHQSDRSFHTSRSTDSECQLEHSLTPRQLRAFLDDWGIVNATIEHFDILFRLLLFRYTRTLPDEITQDSPTISFREFVMELTRSLQFHTDQIG